MSTNPDINRLSLEERIKRLEARFPVSGNGVGFGGPILWDSYPSNAFTDIGHGVVFKLDIDNLGTAHASLRVLDGMNLKLYSYFPKIFLSPSFGLPESICRVMYSKTINKPSGITAVLSLPIDVTALDKYVRNRVDSASPAIQVRGTPSRTQKLVAQPFMTLGVSLRGTYSQTEANKIVVNISGASLASTIASVFFGRAFLAGSSIGNDTTFRLVPPSNFEVGHTNDTAGELIQSQGFYSLADVPDIYHTVYPESWLR